MTDPISRDSEEMQIVPAQKIRGTIAGLFKAQGRGFVTEPVDKLALTFQGIPGDYHAGNTRKSGAREPWYPRGTEMRNERQLSILAPDDLELVAKRLSIPQLKAEWIGGNMLLDGVEQLTTLPPRTILMFEGGVTIRIDGDNLPCRSAGRSIATQFEGRDDIELEFVKQARGLRGLVGWVEIEGVVHAGEVFEARIPAQRIYRAS